ncbi:MAG: AraC family ligand binding domain-containing protein [Lentisphaeria bacterium]|nr:AraC family ligand binding domain-containing protein [Lentisphaeria bacterium]
MNVKEKSLALYLSHGRFEDAPEIELPLFVKILDSQTECEDHTHDFAELVIVRQGTGVLVCNNVSRTITARDVFVIPPGACHRYEKTAGLSLANLMFPPAGCPCRNWICRCCPDTMRCLCCAMIFLPIRKLFPASPLHLNYTALWKIYCK